MLDFTEFFKTSIRVREIETGREFDGVRMDSAFESPCPDKFTMTFIDKVVEENEPVIGPAGAIREVPKARTMQGMAKQFNFDQGDYHGGNIRGKAGDYILFDGVGFQVVQGKDGRGVPVFDKRFMKL